MKDENVGEATRRAAREEEERKKRMAEKQKMVSSGSDIDLPLISCTRIWMRVCLLKLW
jgi:hypothetical protein